MESDTLMTAEGQAQLQAEVDELIAKRPAMAAKIKSARELGDLKENAEYHAAKDEQGFLETRILQIERQLRTAKVIDAGGSSTATLGSHVEVKDLDAGDQETWIITGVEEADPMENRISYESPIGSALMGASVGDTVSAQLPRGEMRMQVVKIS